MKRKYVIQVFSNSLAAAIRTASINTYLPQEAHNTTDFVELVNNTFDIINDSSFN